MNNFTYISLQLIAPTLADRAYDVDNQQLHRYKYRNPQLEYWVSPSVHYDL